jgi:hypothetical protein
MVMLRALLGLAALFMLMGSATASGAGDKATVEELKSAIVQGPWARNYFRR